MPLLSEALAAHRHLVYDYALRLLGSEDDAADVTQEVLIRLWRNGESVEPDSRRAWVIRVTRNVCLDALRSSKVRHHRTPVASALVEAASDHEPTPDVLTESADFRRHVDAALSALDEPQRSIVILREIEGLGYRDIARALELPVNTVKVYLHRGRRRMRELLRASLPPDDLLP